MSVPADRSDPRKLVRELLDSLELIGDGDWTPQDVLANLVAREFLAALDREAALRGFVRAADADAKGAEAQRDTLRDALERALDCKGWGEGLVSKRGGPPAICAACEAGVREAWAATEGQNG